MENRIEQPIIKIRTISRQQPKGYHAPITKAFKKEMMYKLLIPTLLIALYMFGTIMTAVNLLASKLDLSMTLFNLPVTVGTSLVLQSIRIPDILIITVIILSNLLSFGISMFLEWRNVIKDKGVRPLLSTLRILIRYMAISNLIPALMVMLSVLI